MRPAKVVFMNAAREFRGREGRKGRRGSRRRRKRKRERMGLAMLIN